MDKQQIAHTLEKEIVEIDKTLTKLCYVRNQTIDTFYARELNDVINKLIAHKQKLENIVTNIVEDAKHFNPNFNR